MNERKKERSRLRTHLGGSVSDQRPDKINALARFSDFRREGMSLVPTYTEGTEYAHERLARTALSTFSDYGISYNITNYN